MTRLRSVDQLRELNRPDSTSPRTPARPSTLPPSSLGDVIEGRIGIHDSNHFEVKLDYTIDPRAAVNRYHIATYFFIPRSLGINGYTYTREQFYSDIQAYIRFKTPAVGLAALGDAANQSSPLARVLAALPRLLEDPHRQDVLDQVSYNLKLLGCLVRANVRDRVTQLAESVHKAHEQAPARERLIEDVRDAGHRLLAELELVMRGFRGARSTLLDPVIPRWLGETHQYVDEYLSLAIEANLTRLLQQLDADTDNSLGELRTRVRERLCAERLHRQACAYPSLLDTEGRANEHYVYRQGVLKKFVMSVLFLEISKEAQGRRIADIGAGLAAGVAMLFAAVAAVYSQLWWGLNTWPFIAALVISYVLKDRIKDWLKSYFSSKMTRWLSDYSVRIHDPHHDVAIGSCREAFSFIARDQIPPEVLAFRRRDDRSLIEGTSKPEVVMKYEKEVQLSANVIERLHGLHHDINDIIRFDISQFLVRTDDPVSRILAYNPETDRVEPVECPKVYHLNMVFVRRTGDQPPAMERIRVILDKRGIIRLEEA